MFADEKGMFNDAIDVVLLTGKASTSYIQRKLRIGYARAAYIMDLLEEAGVISEHKGDAKPRTVLIDASDAEKFKVDVE